MISNIIYPNIIRHTRWQKDADNENDNIKKNDIAFWSLRPFFNFN